MIGGTNVQFAHDPVTDRIIVIEINPRTSRSSALASKATGFPIALVSAMLAAGLTLKDIPCGKYGTLDKYVPDGDYVELSSLHVGHLRNSKVSKTNLEHRCVPLVKL